MQENICTLSDLDIGQIAKIERINLDASQRKRISRFGIIEGAKLRKTLCSPFRDPCAYLVHSSVIALRRNDTDKILVTIIDGENLPNE